MLRPVSLEDDVGQRWRRVVVGQHSAAEIAEVIGEYQVSQSGAAFSGSAAFAVQAAAGEAAATAAAAVASVRRRDAVKNRGVRVGVDKHHDIVSAGRTRSDAAGK